MSVSIGVTNWVVIGTSLLATDPKETTANWSTFCMKSPIKLLTASGRYVPPSVQPSVVRGQPGFMEYEWSKTRVMISGSRVAWAVSLTARVFNDRYGPSIGRRPRKNVLFVAEALAFRYTLVEPPVKELLKVIVGMGVPVT